MPQPARRVRLSEHDILELMRGCGPRRDELVIGLLGLQGLRPRQVSWLLYGDLDLDADTLTLVHADAPDPLGWPRAADRTDTVRLDPDLAGALRSYVRHDRNAPRRPQDPLLTQRPGLNRPITPDQVNHVVRKVSREAHPWLGREFTVADLRWSYATDQAERGVPLDELAARLGHPGEQSVRKFLERGFE